MSNRKEPDSQARRGMAFDRVRPFLGATTLVLMDLDNEQLRHAVWLLRRLGRSTDLPDGARSLLEEAADLAGEATILSMIHLLEQRERHPAEAKVAGRMSQELEQEARDIVGATTRRHDYLEDRIDAVERIQGENRERLDILERKIVSELGDL